MIVELIKFISLEKKFQKKENVPKNALSRTSYNREITSQQNGMVKRSDTHVFRESICGNLSWTISIPHKHFHGRTTTMFLRGVIHGHCCGFPKDLEGQATFGCLEAVYHLQRSISSRSVMSVIGITHVVICLFRL